MPVFYGMLAFTRLFENGDAAIFKLKSSVQSRYVKGKTGLDTQCRRDGCKVAVILNYFGVVEEPTMSLML
jgi:hypothetical protein